MKRAMQTASSGQCNRKNEKIDRIDANIYQRVLYPLTPNIDTVVS
jgi:hypothetical protein